MVISQKYPEAGSHAYPVPDSSSHRHPWFPRPMLFVLDKNHKNQKCQRH